MNRKYQFFISSTYEDLKEERKAAIHAVLTLNQFPVGMEMFSAADEEQWQIITEAIDSSDYYILIIGNRYGAIIEDGVDVGISYTEKEYNYAITKEIPVLAFIIDKSLESFSAEEIKAEGDKISKLQAFKEKVKQSHRTVKFWKNADNVEALVTQAIVKSLARGNRPGWVRSTDFDVDKSLAEITRLTERVHLLEKLNSDLRLEDSRKPEITVRYQKNFDMNGNEVNDDSEVEITDDGVIHFHISKVDMSDVDNTGGCVVYNDEVGKEHIATYDEVRSFRYLCKNSFSILFEICNSGNLKATDVRVRMEFPDNLMVVSARELNEFRYPHMGYAQNAYKNRNRIFCEPKEVPDKGDNRVTGNEYKRDEAQKSTQNIKFVSIDELLTSDDISNLLDPADIDEVVSILPGEIMMDFPAVRHQDSEFFRGAYILPLAAGEFEIKCTVLCNEKPDALTQMIKIAVD